jgi:hypothetical protein
MFINVILVVFAEMGELSSGRNESIEERDLQD